MDINKLDSFFDSEIDSKLIGNRLRNSINTYIDDALDMTADFIMDEYQLTFAGLIEGEAKKLVIKLLRGEDLQNFYLIDHHDNYGIRKKLIEDFGDEVTKAEIKSLKDQINRMQYKEAF